MNKTVIKQILRTIHNTRNRFIAIFAITVLGVGFLTGLLCTGPDMKESVDRFYDTLNFMDIDIKSTMGLTDEDLKEVSSFTGVRQVTPLYQQDRTLSDANGEQITVRMTALDLRNLSDDDANLPILVSGRLPRKAGECVEVLIGPFSDTGTIGDVIRLDDMDDPDDEHFVRKKFKIVGLVNVPLSMSVDKEMTNVGSGSISEYYYVLPEVIDSDVYTDFYLTLDDASDMDTFTDEYQDWVDDHIDRLKDLGKIREKARYDSLIDEANDKIKEGEDEYKEEKAKAEKELSNAKKELKDAEKEIADGENELADGRKELDDAWSELSDADKELTDAAKKLSDAKNELDSNASDIEKARKALRETPSKIEDAKDAIKDYEKGLKEYEKGKKKLDESKTKLDDGEKEYSKGLAEYEAGEKAYSDGLKEYQKGEEGYAAGLSQYEEGQASYEAGRAEYEAGEAAYSEGLEAYEASKAEYDEGVAAYEALQEALEYASDEEKPMIEAQLEIMKTQLESAEIELAAAKEQLDQTRVQLDQAKVTLDETESELIEAKAQLDASREQLDDAYETLDASRKQLDEAKTGLEKGRNELDEGWDAYNEGKSELDDAKAQLDKAAPDIKKARDAISEWDEKYPELISAVSQYEDGQKAYEDGLAEYLDGKKEYQEGLDKVRDGEAEYAENLAKLNDAKEELADGWEEYEVARKEADDKFREAEEELEDARRKRDEIEYPKWYVLDRNANPTYMSFVENADKVTDISKVFPVFFFLVAALVALTTMTRMVEEERTEIGTMKALGYRNRVIAFKYLIYAGLAGVLGSVAGILIGQWIFPTIIWNAYGIMYYYPGFRTQFLPQFAIPSALAAVLSVLGATWWAVNDSLKDKPATLMLPKAPKAGKRILLESVTPVWSKLSFIWKVTMRNIFRYKKRFFMTIIGIAGCTALLLTGFGLRDSIDHIVERQFAEIQKYDLTVSVDEKIEDADRTLFENYLNDTGERFVTIHSEMGEAKHGKSKENVTIEVPDVTETFTDFVDLRIRSNNEKLIFNDDSVVLAEKLADNLGVKIGDTFTLENSDSEEGEFTVTAITENYITGYVYIGRKAWDEVYPNRGGSDTYLIDSETQSSDEDYKLTEILKYEGITSAMFSTSIIETFSNMLNKIDYIVIVLIICAGLLAFVVLYNLTNINISERQKEIATIKVLGFYHGEVNSYIYRETVLLSIFGIMLGLVLGVLLHKFVIVTVEMTAIMFGREIFAMSFVYSALITLIFTGLVCLALSGRLKKISMVESLKSVD